MSERPSLNAEMMQTLLQAQRNEITEYHVYKRLAKLLRDKGNSQVLHRIAENEREHYRFWQEYTEQ